MEVLKRDLPQLRCYRQPALDYTIEHSTNGQNWIAVAALSANTLRYISYGLARHTLDWRQVLASIGPGQSHSMLKWVHDQHPSAVYRGFLCHHL